MKRFGMSVIALCAIGANGCAQVQQPYRFSISNVAAIDSVMRALASIGETTVTADRQAGIVNTQWRDTGVIYGEIARATATIVRRYIVTLTPVDSGTEVLVRADTRRCARGHFSVGDNGLQGNCEQMTGVVDSHQKDVDALGAQLRQSLGAGAPVAPPPPE